MYVLNSGKCISESQVHMGMRMWEDKSYSSLGSLSEARFSFDETQELEGLICYINKAKFLPHKGSGLSYDIRSVDMHDLFLPWGTT